jgi:hypothetical protein
MKLATKRFAGRTINLRRRADLDDAPGLHDRDAVRHHHRLLEAVGNVDEGAPRALVKLLELDLQRLPKAVVDGRQRLVEEQDLGVRGEGAGERHALPFAAGTLGHRAV